MEHNHRLAQADRKQELDVHTIRQNERLNRYLNENLTSPSLCLVSVAEHMNISIYAVSRLIKRTTGQSFRVYITRKRLELAFDLLQSPEATVSQIACRVGFENPAYFSSVFKKHYGFTPSSVKRNR